jgi:hypothetical protein
MATISWSRRSYEAAVLLVPLDPDARAALQAQEPGALHGITVAGTGDGRASSSELERAVYAADVVVLLVRDLAAVDPSLVVHIGDLARSNGTLLSAVIVSPDLIWHDAASHRSAAALREAVDTVVILSDLTLAIAFFQTLRGGTCDDDREHAEADGVLSS